MSLAVLALAIAGGAPAARAQAPASPLVGEWRWNRGESSAEQGDPTPRGVVLTITAADPQHMQWTLSGTDARGKPHQQIYDGAGDGRLAPVRGGPEGTMAAFAVNAGAMTVTYTDRSGAVREQTSCAVSADRRKLVCQGSLLDGQGHATSFRDVYDRH